MKQIKSILVGLFCISLISTMSFFTIFAASPDVYTDIHEIVNNGASLSIPNTLSITYPTTTTSTTTDTFVIGGTSDPSQPLYMNNSEITNRNPNGMFYVTVSVPSDGIYQCIFKQGEITKAVPIYKNVEAPNPPVQISSRTIQRTISSALDNTTYPSYNIVSNNKKITLSCIAPTGATVSATVLDHTYSLSQDQPSQTNGVGTKFSTVLDLSGSLDDSKIYTLGNIKYTINFNGQTSETISQGKIYFSKTLPPVVKVYWTYAFLMDKPSTASNTLSILKKGVIDKVINYDAEAKMYQLSCGGWVNEKFIEPVFEYTSVINEISNANFYSDSKCEKIILSGTNNPIFTSALTNDKLIIRLYNSTGIPDLSTLCQNSSLFSNIYSKTESNYIEINCEFNDRNLIWGYNIEFDGNNTVIYAKKKPIISPNSTKPLDGITILVDAGHGGSDIGASGLIANIGGSPEKDINLINALAVKKRLESLGATVITTRTTDVFVPLNRRAEIIESEKPDFVLIYHADSSSNVNVEGATYYYSNPNSISFNTLITNKTCAYVDKPSRPIKNMDFYIARNTLCPTAFGEIGFLTSPKDIVSLYSANSIFGVANAAGDSIIEYLKK